MAEPQTTNDLRIKRLNRVGEYISERLANRFSPWGMDDHAVVVAILNGEKDSEEWSLLVPGSTDKLVEELVETESKNETRLDRIEHALIIMASRLFGEQSYQEIKDVLSGKYETAAKDPGSTR